MHFYIGDHPAPLTVEPVSVVLSPGSTAAAELVLATGAAQELVTAVDGGTIHVYLPVMTLTGKHSVRIVATTSDSVLTLPPITVVVEHEDGDGWHTLDSARAEWADAPEGDDDEDARLYDLLQIAREQVLAFAPARQDGDPVPARYRAAQVMQARNLWNGLRKNPGEETMGADGFSVTIFPLDWNVRALIRPIRAVPVVG